MYNLPAAAARTILYDAERGIHQQHGEFHRARGINFADMPSDKHPGAALPSRQGRNSIFPNGQWCFVPGRWDARAGHTGDVQGIGGHDA
jgi:hypothetical protein